MTTKTKQYNNIEYAFFGDSLEGQFEQARKEGVLDVLKILELDEVHSDNHLVQAINYFKEKMALQKKMRPLIF